MWKCEALEEFPSGVRTLGEIGILWMQILKEDLRIRRFDKFEGTADVGMQGFGRISIRNGHAHDIGEIGILWMQILEEGSARIRRLDKFERTSYEKM
jgi:hypothetical protein